MNFSFRVASNPQAALKGAEDGLENTTGKRFCASLRITKFIDTKVAAIKCRVLTNN